LKAAEKLFASKGFDGARVDDIAQEAGVNKALIYYYFKSKKSILEELFSNLIEELVKLSFSAVEDGFASLETGEEMLQQVEWFYEFMDSRKDTLRIMMMESLKASEEKPPLFRFSEIAMSDEAERIKELFRSKGFNVDDIDMDEALIADFFTAIIPMISFAFYHEKWSKHFSIEPDELKKKFFSVFLTTHLAYHKEQLMKLK